MKMLPVTNSSMMSQADSLKKLTLMVKKRFTITMKIRANWQPVLKSHLLMDKTSKTELHRKTEFNNLSLTVWG
ncbi:hypothetical protein ABFP12_18590, partial [Acinetobacter baumannii]